MTLLEEAKEKYPVGTKYKCVNNPGVTRLVKEGKFYSIHNQINGDSGEGVICILENGNIRWAEVLEYPNNHTFKHSTMAFTKDNVVGVRFLNSINVEHYVEQSTKYSSEVEIIDVHGKRKCSETKDRVAFLFNENTVWKPISSPCSPLPTPVTTIPIQLYPL